MAPGYSVPSVVMVLQLWAGGSLKSIDPIGRGIHGMKLHVPTNEDMATAFQTDVLDGCHWQQLFCV